MTPSAGMTTPPLASGLACGATAASSAPSARYAGTPLRPAFSTNSAPRLASSASRYSATMPQRRNWTPSRAVRSSQRGLDAVTSRASRLDEGSVQPLAVIPLLDLDVPSPTSCRASMTTTDRSSRDRRKATAVPTTPAPTTATSASTRPPAVMTAPPGTRRPGRGRAAAPPGRR